MKFRSHPLRNLIAVVLIMLLTAAVALAAAPKAGKTYSGTISASKVNGFSAPVSFKVSSNGKQLQKFQYANRCFASSGKPVGDPYKTEVISVGKIAVSGGKFSVKNVKTTSKLVTTTSSVKGKFTSATKATGTIKFTQHGTFGPPGGITCGPVTLKFTATTK